MTPELARLIVYVHEFVGASILSAVYYGRKPRDFDKQAATIALYNQAVKYLKETGEDV